jgi:hypothetical protein
MIAVIYTPTIMSGPVLRWYETETRDGVLYRTNEVANAGRESGTLLADTPELCLPVVLAHKTIKDEFLSSHREPRAESWRQWITHETVGMFGDELRAVGS